MELVAHHKTIRFKLLLALYIASDADCDFSMNMEKLAEQRQLDNRRFLKAFKYLLEENFVRLCDGGGEYQSALTHKGLKVVEEVFLDAQKQTYYFPPYQKMRKH
jgi:hypothetical protein